MYKKDEYTLNAANGSRDSCFKARNAGERRLAAPTTETGKFEYVKPAATTITLPGDPCDTFIETHAEVQRAMGFQMRRTIRKCASNFEN